MTTTFDIYRAARLLIDKHGDEVPIHAAMRADELFEAGDMDGVAGPTTGQSGYLKGAVSAYPFPY